jgi:geranylgeranyl diphosphate synthase type I
MPLQTFLNHYLPALEGEMQALVGTGDALSSLQTRHSDGAPSPLQTRHSDGARYSGLFGMLRYHLGWADQAFNPCRTRTGKRVRPVLCLLACEGCDGNWEQALPAGAAIEMIHNFSLIHDDIEDGDQTRRGRPTVWALWGEAQGINAGDALFVLAQLALVRLSERGLPGDTVTAAMRLLNDTCLALTRGQYLDIGFEAREHVPIADYLAMVEGKTAALIACACEMGGLVAEAGQAQREHLRSFGRHLGLAFQMRDDVLGIWGDPAVTGKPVGADIARRKKTLPILHGLERSAQLRTLLAQETLSADDVRHATRLLEGTGSRAYTEQLERQNHTQALAALDAAGLRGLAAEALQELADKLMDRER